MKGYDGTRMSHVKVTPSGLVTESQRLAASKLGGDVEYDVAGRVIADASRGITSIEYNSDSHPTKIKFSGGNTQTLVWDNMGNRISTTYLTLNSSLVRSNQTGDNIEVTGRPYYFTETKRRYYSCGQIAIDDSLVMTRFPGGYLTGDGKARYYFADYQGNNLATVDAEGKIVESTSYYPYGLPWDEPTENPYLYGDKEYDNVHGLGEYYYGARQSVPVLAGGFTTIDPLCEKRQWESPYILCGGNPIRNVDPDGNSTWVLCQGEKKYKVVTGDIYDNDLNIYVVTMDEYGNYHKGKSIGETTSMTSFYQCESDNLSEGKWVESIIDMNDTSGESFLNDMMDNTPPLGDYAVNALNGEKYDFKTSDGSSEINGYYRGMPIGTSSLGKPLITSARDVGNIAAGYVAGANGLSWNMARAGFDSLEKIASHNINAHEGISTQNAERYGFKLGNSKSNWSKGCNFTISTGCLYLSRYQYFTKALYWYFSRK